MDTQEEKVYVAPGNDLQDGFKTLDWTLGKWKHNPISIVILHVTYNISNDFVYTPFGKLPASSMSDEKLEVLKKYEQEKMDKLLSKYIAFCGKVKAEIFKVEKSDDPIHMVLVDLISRLRITKLVMGITFMKGSSWRSKNAISGSFYIHQHVPDFCEFFITCGGKLVSLKGGNGGGLEEDDGALSAKRTNFKSWIGNCFTENTKNSPGRSCNHSPKDLNSLNSQNRWDNHAQEMENYFQHLLTLNLDEEICVEESDILQTGTTESGVPEHADSSMSLAVQMECMRSKIDEAREIIRSKREETRANAERCAKAESAIRLCNCRVEELESKMKEVVTNRIEIRNNLDVEKEQIQEIASDIQESRNRLCSLLQLQSELSNKLQMSSLARSHAEAHLENAAVARAEMVREIEQLRRQRDLLQRRIEFCREKDAIGRVAKLSQLSCEYREFTAEDIRLATDGFSENLRLKSGGDLTKVYRGRINHTSVAIKMLSSDDSFSQEAYVTKVKFLTNIRHPHLVAMIGFCFEPKCIIYEYMHNGNLRNILSSSQRNRTRRNQSLRWNDRIRIANEVCSGLSYLHLARPKPIVHGRLTASNILLDRNHVAKISGFGLVEHCDEHNVRSDIQAFGVILLHLLTGRDWLGLVEEAAEMDRFASAQVLDKMAGQWPLDLAEEIFRMAVRCISINNGPNADFSPPKIMEELDEIKSKADDMVAKGGCEGAMDDGGVDKEDASEVPSIFVCPIFRDVMKNPHVAADGFSYELEAIEEWLEMGHDTSPMTNLRLSHKFITPNHILRSLVEEWHDKKSTIPP